MPDSGVTSGYVATVDDLLLTAAEGVARYIWRSMTGEARKVVKLSAGGQAKAQEHA